MVLFIRSDIALSSPIAGTPILPAPPYTSDSFSRADSSSLGQSDAARGGTSRPWLGTATTFGITNQRAVVKSDNAVTFFTGFQPEFLDVEVAFVIHEKPTTDSVWLDVRRPLAAVNPTQDAIRLAVGTSGNLQLMTRVSTIGANVGAAIKYSAGDRVALRVKGTQVQLSLNGDVLLTETVADPQLQTGRHVGFAGTQNSKSFAFDDFVVSPI